MKAETNSEEKRGEFLVAIVQRPLDLSYAREKHWYRIPVESADRLLGKQWPPKWIGFYQTKAFGSEAYSVRHYSHVEGSTIVSRRELFPDEPENEKAERKYYKLKLGELKSLDYPIHSRRFRRIVFIPTTWSKFENASEINDLYAESPLEDKLWAAMKRQQISAERQELVSIGAKNYILDFAIYCDKGNLGVETDGDWYHNASERVKADKRRDNDLHANGWQTLRFTTDEIREQLETYCVGKITETIDSLGGLSEEGKFMPRRFGGEYGYQPSLFDARADYYADTAAELDEDEVWNLGDDV